MKSVNSKYVATISPPQFGFNFSGFSSFINYAHSEIGITTGVPRSHRRTMDMWEMFLRKAGVNASKTYFDCFDNGNWW